MLVLWLGDLCLGYYCLAFCWMAFRSLLAIDWLATTWPLAIDCCGVAQLTVMWFMAGWCSLALMSVMRFGLIRFGCRACTGFGLVAP